MDAAIDMATVSTKSTASTTLAKVASFWQLGDAFPIDMGVDLNDSALRQLLSGGGGPLFDLPFAGEVCGLSLPTGNWSSSPSAGDVDNLYARLRFVLDVHVVIVLCLIGFVGNALAIAVLRRDQLNTTSWLLQTLAVVDTAYLVACLFIQSLRTINESTDWMPTLRSSFPRIEPYLWPAASTAQTVTIWTVLLLTVDRYVAVCSPFDPGLRSLRRARISVAIVLVVAVAYNAPLIVEREAVEETDLCTGEKRWRTRKASISTVYFVAYKTVSFFVFRAVGPLVALLVLNARLIGALNRSRRRRKQLAYGIGAAGGAAATASATTAAAAAGAAAGSAGAGGRSPRSSAVGASLPTRPRSGAGAGSGRHRENITLMLVVVVSVFIVCQLPDLGLRIVGTQIEYDLTQTLANDKYRCINSVTNVMLTLNSSVNFLIYCLVGKKFRRIFVRMICGVKSSAAPTADNTDAASATAADLRRRRQVQHQQSVHWRLPVCCCCCRRVASQCSGVAVRNHRLPVADVNTAVGSCRNRMSLEVDATATKAVTTGRQRPDIVKSMSISAVDQSASFEDDGDASGQTPNIEYQHTTTEMC